MSAEAGHQPVLQAELLGDCRWTLQQNQSVITSLKRENKELKAALASLSPAASSRQALVQAELHSLNTQVNDLRKYHNKLVQDRLHGTSRLAQLKDSIKDLETDSQLVFKESPGSQLVKSLNKKLTAALAKHDSAQSTCQELEQTAQSLRDHRLTHNAELSALEGAVADSRGELQDILAAHGAVHQTQDQAKAELASVEQQLIAQRAARTAQLEQHAVQVRRQQEQYAALHQAATQRLQQWKQLLQATDGDSYAATVAGVSNADAAAEMSTAITVFTGQSSAADTAAAALDASATESANAASESSSIVTDHQDAASPLQLGTASPTTGDNAIPAEPAGVDGDAAVPTTMPEESVPEDVSAGQSTHEQTAGSTQLDTAVQEAAPENPIADDSQSVLAPNAAAVAETDTASKDPVSAAAATDATAVSSSAVSTADSMHNAALQSVSPMNVADQATLSNQADMPKSAVALQQASDDASASTGAQGSSEQIGASDGSAASTEGSSPSPDLTCRQAFAALQYATGVMDMTQLVDRFLAQDSTQDALQQLHHDIQTHWQHLHRCSSDLQVLPAMQGRLQEVQHKRQLVHKQAEAAILEAQAQQELNAAQYDQAGRSLVHIKAAVQTLVEKLQPLFPEMALQSASNESLCDAIHSCGTCLKHVQLSLTEAKKQVGLGPRATSDSEGAAVREYELEKIQFSPTSLSKHVSLDALTSSHEAGVKQGNSDSLQGSIVASDASLIQSTWTVSLLSQPDIV